MSAKQKNRNAVLEGQLDHLYRFTGLAGSTLRVDMLIEDILNPLLDEFSEVDVELMRAKDRALFWVYLIEWLAVSGTCMICAVLLWTLMIRRRLYRRVSTTRAL